MNNTLIEYSREIQPMIRDVLYQKELLADFKASDEKAQTLAESVAEAQAELKKYLESNDQSKDILDGIKAVENDIKVAIKGASRGTNYKPAELKQFLIARVKASVEKTVSKGELFSELDKELA
jgi:hypothetical protein